MSEAFDIRNLEHKLDAFPRAGRYLIGFSGGSDSTALLHALYSMTRRLSASLEAIHFNHGIHPDSDSWARHCMQFCSERGIPLTVEPLEPPENEGNLEAVVRALRYASVERHMGEGTLFMTAHTADDQAETFLMHALRGSGPEGLSGIPEIRPLGPGFVARPLLDQTRASLEAYLAANGLAWIDDPANRDLRHDRNFIRHQGNVARGVQSLLADGGFVPESDGTFSRTTLLSLGANVAPLMIRAWLRQQNAPSIPETRLETFLAQIQEASTAKQCEVAWAGWVLKCY
ncbi:MAG: tRNA lysidine(34) synthetase TilS, partial [Xanthomonadales bacterium]|nr:tRNA lysidine(34) synthetase TilS [Xanthomonadales bacterium]